jgi:hypothetical protein
MHRGELLHVCARGTETVLKEARVLDTQGNSFIHDVQELKARYQDILDNCPVNHDNVDYLKAKLQKPQLFIGRHYSHKRGWFLFQRFVDHLRYRFESWAWVIPHFLAIAAVGIVLKIFIFDDAQQIPVAPPAVPDVAPTNSQ